MPKSLSIIIPAYNEARRLPFTLKQLAKISLPTGYGLHEVLVIDDGSTDNTAKVAQKYRADLPLKIIGWTNNQGKGYAVRHGMLAARGDLKLFMDADNSVPVGRYLPIFLKALEDGCQVVIASIHLNGARVMDKDKRLYRRSLGLAAKQLIGKTVLPGLSDSQRGFKLFTKEAANITFSRQTIDGYGFDIEILMVAQRHKLPIKELPIAWQNGKGSKVALRDYFKTLAELAKIKINQRKGRYG